MAGRAFQHSSGTFWAGLVHSRLFWVLLGSSEPVWKLHRPTSSAGQPCPVGQPCLPGPFIRRPIVSVGQPLSVGLSPVRPAALCPAHPQRFLAPAHASCAPRSPHLRERVTWPSPVGLPRNPPAAFLAHRASLRPAHHACASSARRPARTPLVAIQLPLANQLPNFGNSARQGFTSKFPTYVSP